MRSGGGYPPRLEIELLRRGGIPPPPENRTAAAEGGIPPPRLKTELLLGRGGGRGVYTPSSNNNSIAKVRTTLRDMGDIKMLFHLFFPCCLSPSHFSIFRYMAREAGNVCKTYVAALGTFLDIENFILRTFVFFIFFGRFPTLPT